MTTRYQGLTDFESITRPQIGQSEEDAWDGQPVALTKTAPAAFTEAATIINETRSLADPALISRLKERLGRVATTAPMTYEGLNLPQLAQKTEEIYTVLHFIETAPEFGRDRIFATDRNKLVTRLHQAQHNLFMASLRKLTREHVDPQSPEGKTLLQLLERSYTYLQNATLEDSLDIKVELSSAPLTPTLQLPIATILQHVEQNILKLIPQSVESLLQGISKIEGLRTIAVYRQKLDEFLRKSTDFKALIAISDNLHQREEEIIHLAVARLRPVAATAPRPQAPMPAPAVVPPKASPAPMPPPAPGAIPVAAIRIREIAATIERCLALPFDDKTITYESDLIYLAEQTLENVAELLTATPPGILDDKTFMSLASFFTLTNRIPVEATYRDDELLNRQSDFRTKLQYAEKLVFDDSHRPLSWNVREGSSSSNPWLCQQSKIYLENRRFISVNIQQDVPAGGQNLRRLLVFTNVSVAQSLGKINSSVLQGTAGGETLDRAYFFAHPDPETPIPVIACSDLVPPSTIPHIHRDIGTIALGVKHTPRHGKTPSGLIRNVESLFRFFCTGIGRIKMGADVYYARAVVKHEGQFREVLLSNQVHPDFEIGTDDCCGPFHLLAGATSEAVQGKLLPPNFTFPSEEQKSKMTDDELQQYDQLLLRHIVFPLFPNGRRPATSEIAQKDIVAPHEALIMLTDFVQKDDSIAVLIEKLKTTYVHIGPGLALISLYCLFMTYVHQIRNEFSILESNDQHYVYTLHPPAIFALPCAPGARIMNRLQCLAFKCMKRDAFRNLQNFVPNCSRDDDLLQCYQKIFGERVVEMKDFFDPALGWKVPAGTALVIHNNSDTYGFNLRYEPSGASLDGTVGNFSSVFVFDPQRPEALQNAEYDVGPCYGGLSIIEDRQPYGDAPAASAPPAVVAIPMEGRGRRARPYRSSPKAAAVVLTPVNIERIFYSPLLEGNEAFHYKEFSIFKIGKDHCIGIQPTEDYDQKRPYNIITIGTQSPPVIYWNGLVA